MDRSLGLLLIAVGTGVLLVGVGLWAGAFNWFGRLPGDLRIEAGRSRVFIPITSMLLVSVVLTLVLNLILRR